MTPFIDPDGKYLIFKRMGMNNGFGASDLYISFRNEKGDFQKAINMGKRINTAEDEGNPYISPDRKYLFFSRGGGNDYYWIRATVIDDLKQEYDK